MVTQGPISAVRDHKKIGDDIDDAYIACVAATTDLRTYLVRPLGNRMEKFLAFYEPFTGLFLHTVNLKEMATPDDEQLIGEISRWIEFQGVPSMKRMRYGIHLFQRYQKELLTKSIVVPSRM
jgi:hypothetical protein